MHDDGHMGVIITIGAEKNRMRRMDTGALTKETIATTKHKIKGWRSDSPLQFGHAVELVVVAASEALGEGIVLDLQLRNLIAKTGEGLKL